MAETEKTPDELLEEMLKTGDSGRFKRNPRPGVGRFKLAIKEIKTIADKPSEQLVMVDGKPTKAVVPGRVTAYILEALVTESTCADNPVGTMVGIYFANSGKKDVAKMEIGRQFDFAMATLYSLGLPKSEKADRAMYNSVWQDDGAAVQGVEISLVTEKSKYGKGEKKGQVRVGEDGQPFLDYNWTSCPNVEAKVLERRATFAAEAKAAA